MAALLKSISHAHISLSLSHDLSLVAALRRSISNNLPLLVSASRLIVEASESLLVSVSRSNDFFTVDTTQCQCPLLNLVDKILQLNRRGWLRIKSHKIFK